MANPGTTNLVSWWKLDETSGNRSDAHGSNTLTDIGTVTYSRAKHYWGANFVRSQGERLEINDNTSLQTGNIDFSFGGWFRLTSLGITQYILAKMVNTTDGEYQLYVNTSNKLVFEITDGTATLITVGHPTTLTTNTWYWFIAYHDSVNDEIGISINNGSFTTQTTNGTAPTAGDGSKKFMLGARSDGVNSLDGDLDEIFFYKKMLSSSELTWLYNVSFGRKYENLSPPTPVNPGLTNLVSWWKMEETSGVRYDAHGSMDLSQNGTIGYRTGIKNNAADFPASNGYELYHADHADLRFGDFDFTIAGWVKFDLFTGSRFVISKHDGTNFSYTIYFTSYDNSIYWAIDGPAGGNTTTSNIIDIVNALGEWIFCIFSYDATNDEYWIRFQNGTGFPKFTNRYPDSSAAASENFALGCRALSDATSRLNGGIDELAIYKRLLTAAEQEWLFNDGAGRTYTDLLDNLTATGITATPVVGNPAADVDQLDADGIAVYPILDKPTLHIPIAPVSLARTAPIMPMAYIYDSSLNILGVIEDYYSLIWAERYYEMGDFEMELPIEYVLNSNIAFDNFLYIPISDKIMVIEDIKPESLEDQDTLRVSGRSVESILKRRIIETQVDVDGVAETLAYAFMEDNVTNPADTNRTISIFKTTFPSVTLTETFKEQVDQQPLYDLIEQICKSTGLGFKIVNESSELAFSLYKGADRSFAQSTNPWVIFADAFGNVYTSSFYDSIKEKVNIILVSSNDSVYKELYVWEAGQSEPTGLNRFENIMETTIDRWAGIKVDTSDPEPTYDGPQLTHIQSGYHHLTAVGITVNPFVGEEPNTPKEPLSDDEVLNILTTRGQQKVTEYKTVGVFEGTFDITGNFKYGTDFSLGDIVQCVLENRNIKARVIELVRSYSTEGEESYVTMDFII